MATLQELAEEYEVEPNDLRDVADLPVDLSPYDELTWEQEAEIRENWETDDTDE